MSFLERGYSYFEELVSAEHHGQGADTNRGDLESTQPETAVADHAKTLEARIPTGPESDKDIGTYPFKIEFTDQEMLEGSPIFEGARLPHDN